MNSDSSLGKTVILYVILTTRCNHRDSQNSSSMESIAFSLSTMWTMYSAGWGEVMAWGWPLWDPATGSTVAQELHNGDNKPWKRGWTGVWTPICQEEHCALGGTFPPAGAGKMFRISPPPTHTHSTTYTHLVWILKLANGWQVWACLRIWKTGNYVPEKAHIWCLKSKTTWVLKSKSFFFFFGFSSPAFARR